MKKTNKIKVWILGQKKVTTTKFYLRVFGATFLVIGFVLGCYLTVTNVIFPIIFAVEQAEKTVDTDTDFGYGVFDDTEVAGRGGGAVVQLNGDGGENWWDPNYSFRKLITVTTQDAISAGYTVFLTEDLQDLVDSNKANSDYSDIRIVAYNRISGIFEIYDTDGSIIEDTLRIGIDRHIVGANSIRLKILSAISASSTSETSGSYSYYLYYGYSLASNPPTNTGNVYLNKNVDMEDGGSRPDYWYKTSIYQGPEPIKSTDAYNGTYSLGKEGSSNQRDLGMSTIVSLTSGDKVKASIYLKISGSGSGVYLGRVNGGTEADGTSYSGYVWWVTEQGDTGGEWQFFETTYTAVGNYNYRMWIYPYHFTGNVYADLAIIRKYTDNEPSVSSSSEQSALAPLGSWQSAGSGVNVIDLVWNGGWKDDLTETASFAASINIPANTSVKFEAQSAADPANFEEANYKDLGVCVLGDPTDPCPADNVFKKTAAELGAIGILTKDSRHIRIRAALTSSDGISNPSVDKIAVYYFKDNTKPSKNPDSETIEARDQQGGTVFLSTEDWHNYPNPWFKWQGAEDDCANPPESCSGIKGYYVYFGGDAAAIPETAGLPQNSDEYKALSLSSGETYYLRLQAYDLEGNYFTGEDPPDYLSYTLFTYKYDKTPPENPGYLNTPSDFLSTKKFSFFWPTAGGDAAQDSYSGVKGYQYKIGDCSWYGPNHTDPDGLEDCFPKEAGNYETNETYDYDCLNEGTSYIYLRTIDEAGNVSSGAIQGVVKINTAAPSAPRNLAVSPDYSKENSFSFSWQEPEIQPAPIEEYRYSINSLPTETNYTSAADTSLPENPYATIRGVNTFYVAAVAQGGAVNWEDYAQINFECDSAAPGIPLSLEIFDTSIRATKNYSITLKWDAPEFEGTGFEGFKIYRSETKGADCQKDFSSFEEIAATSGTAYVDSNLKSKTYYYCLKAYDNTNQLSSPSSTAKIKPTGRWTSPPDLIEEPEAFPKTRSATIAWLTSREGNSFVQYGIKSSAYGNEIGSSFLSACHSIVLSGLEPDTVYFYRVLFTDEDGNTGTSNECSFKTGPPPIVSEVSVSDISLYSAYLSFTVENTIKASVYYGKTTMYGGALAISTSTKESSYTLKFSDLDDGTLYHYMIELKDEEGNKYLFEDHTFETLPRPRVSNVKVGQVFGKPSATLKIEFDSNTPISTICSFWPTGDPSQKKEVYDIKPKTKHSIEISGLKDNTLYLLLARGVDRLGNEAQSDIQRITTATDTRPPRISNLYVEQNITGQGREAKSQVIVSWDTDEPSTGQVGYIQGSAGSFTSFTKEDIILATSHSVVISGLSPSTIYKLGAVSYDGARNKAVSEDYILITQKATESVLDLILRSLRNTFGR